MVSESFREGGVRGFLDRHDASLRDGLVLTHGAGGDCRMLLLVSVARAFVETGVTVLRCDLPFRQKRPHGPPSPSTAAADRAGLKEALAALRGIVPGRLFLGGQSYGGRQASMLAAEEPGLAGPDAHGPLPHAAHSDAVRARTAGSLRQLR
jgi:predicted alpha/beta-hydrolase family hydrolase